MSMFCFRVIKPMNSFGTLWPSLLYNSFFLLYWNCMLCQAPLLEWNPWKKIFGLQCLTQLLNEYKSKCMSEGITSSSISNGKISFASSSVLQKEVCYKSAGFPQCTVMERTCSWFKSSRNYHAGTTEPEAEWRLWCLWANRDLSR